MANNPKHVFNFEGILNTKINEKNWKEIKQKIGDAFNELRVGIQEGLAKEEAQKILDIFNKKFAEANIPININLDDLQKNLAKVEENITKALASLNNIDTSALKGIETTLEDIANTTNKIFKKMGDQTQRTFDSIGKGAKNAAKKTIKSVGEIEAALARVNAGKKKGKTEAFKFIEEAVNGKGVRVTTRTKEADAKQIMNKIISQREQVYNSKNSTWEQKYAADISFADSYKIFSKNREC